MNLFLFTATVLIWGTTWIAIALQVGDASAVVSVFYRFATAGILFVGALAAFGKLVMPQRRVQPWILLQACCLFSFNFICFYKAAAYVPSGLSAVIFSLATLFNAVNARLFFDDRISAKVLVACLFGITGLICLFGPDALSGGQNDMIIGAGYACLGTLFFSLGNMVSRRLSSQEVSPITANAWGMCYGAILLLVIASVSGDTFVLPQATSYWAAMVYLAVVGSVLGFTAYLMLLARIGSAQAAYATVLFPVVALGISTVVEGYQWTVLGGIGLGLALMGNLIMFAKPRKPEKAPDLAFQQE